MTNTYYTVYKITNNLNNKYYIGMHQTKNLDDGYMGSGKYLKNAIKKYGIENFSKEILHIFETREEMILMEIELIDPLDNMNYNIRDGGKGGFTEEERDKANIARPIALKEKYGENWGKIVTDRSREIMKEQKKWIWSKEWQEQNPGNFKNDKERQKYANKLSQSAKSRSKRIDTLNEINHQQGEKNSQFGKSWIRNPITRESGKIKKENLQEWLDKGFEKGRYQINAIYIKLE